MYMAFMYTLNGPGTYVFFCVLIFFKSICFVSVDIRLVVKLVIRGLDHCINRQSSRESIIVLLLDNWYFCSCTFFILIYL